MGESGSPTCWLSLSSLLIELDEAKIGSRGDVGRSSEFWPRISMIESVSTVSTNDVFPAFLG